MITTPDPDGRVMVIIIIYLFLPVVEAVDVVLTDSLVESTDVVKAVDGVEDGATINKVSKRERN